MEKLTGQKFLGAFSSAKWQLKIDIANVRLMYINIPNFMPFRLLKSER